MDSLAGDLSMPPPHHPNWCQPLDMLTLAVDWPLSLSSHPLTVAFPFCVTLFSNIFKRPVPDLGLHTPVPVMLSYVFFNPSKLTVFTPSRHKVCTPIDRYVILRFPFPPKFSPLMSLCIMFGFFNVTLGF